MTYCKIKVMAFCEVCGKEYGGKPEDHFKLSYHRPSQYGNLFSVTRTPNKDIGR